MIMKKKRRPVPKAITDKRSVTSAKNGAKGGRPKEEEILYITIKKQDIQAAMKKEDIALAIEKAIKAKLRKVSVYVQTVERLRKAEINYDPFSGVNYLIIINDIPLKFTWELRYFIKDFVSLTQGKKNFTFPLRLPKQVTLEVK